MSGQEEKDTKIKDSIVEENILSKSISLEEISILAKGTLVEIPSWEPGKTIVVRLRKIDITPTIMSAGVIPDQLSLEVSTLFEEDDKFTPDTKASEKVDFDTSKLMPVLDTMAKEALTEPTFDEINAIYPLTLDQKMAIFEFLSGGLRKIKPFRAKRSIND